MRRLFSRLRLAGVIAIFAGLAPIAAGQNAARLEGAVNYMERTVSAHSDRVRAVAFMPDGKLFLSAGADKTAKLCDMATGRVIRSFEGHTRGIFAIAVAPDGKTFATASSDRSIIVWDVATGKVLSHLTGHSGPVIGVAFQANHHLSSAGGDGLRVWDLNTEKTITRGPMAQPYSAAYSADGTRLAVSDVNGRSTLCDAVTCKIIKEMPGAATHMLTVGLSPDGNTVIYNDKDMWYRFDTKANAATKLEEHFAMSSITFSADGQHALTTDFDGIKYWALNPLKREAQFSPSQNEEAHAGAISSDGHHVIAGFGGTDIQGIPNIGGNGVAVFDLGRRAKPIATGPVDGVISWKTIPLKIKKKGTPVEVSKYFRDLNADYLSIAQAGQDWDVCWTTSEVFVHRELGILEPIAKIGELENLRSVQWDGKYLWAYSARSGMYVYTQAGKLVASAGTSETLPTGEGGPVKPLFLGGGKVLLAGAGVLVEKMPAAGWICVLELQPGNPKLKVTTLMHERNGPPLIGWPEKPDPQNALLSPRESMRYGDTELWITYAQTQKTVMPIVRVDLKTLKTKLYNMGSNGTPFGQWDVKGGYFPLWGFGDGTAMIVQEKNYCIATVGPESLIDSPTKPIFNASRKKDYLGIVPFAGKLYLPGTQWVRIDPSTRTAKMLGSGLQFGGKSIRFNVSYGTSAKLGLCAISTYDGVIYQISDDPQHPLENRPIKLGEND